MRPVCLHAGEMGVMLESSSEVTAHRKSRPTMLRLMHTHDFEQTHRVSVDHVLLVHNCRAVQVLHVGLK
jgi:hypothetical protein